jgi:RNA polymerase sigma-70 factor, ECF subfamily
MFDSQPRTASASDLSDESLVLRAQSGSMDAFELIVARFEGRLFNFIARRLGLRHLNSDAEDLTQETFLRAWRGVREFRPEHRFSTWLFTIASRLVVDHQRHRHVRLAGVQRIAEEAIRREQTPHRAEVESDRAAGGRLWSIASQVLSEEQHAALWLRYAEDLSPGEVARVLGKNEVAVRVMLFRARQALAPHLPGAPDDKGQQAGTQKERMDARMSGCATGGVA